VTARRAGIATLAARGRPHSFRSVVTPRSPLARLSALAAAVLFLAGGADRAFAAAHCPHHGALPSRAGDAGIAHAHTGTAPAAPADDSAQTHCTCIGACVTAAGVALALPPMRTLSAPAATRAETPPAPAPTPGPALRDHQLPFATAPPRER
jgi:hypothetical protein